MTQHIKSKLHQAWQTTQELKDVRIQSKKYENEIQRLAHKEEVEVVLLKRIEYLEKQLEGVFFVDYTMDKFKEAIHTEIWACRKCAAGFDTQQQAKLHERSCKINRQVVNGNCYRCGRYGHWASECYARI